jgi:hypothetical protein
MSFLSGDREIIGYLIYFTFTSRIIPVEDRIVVDNWV